MTSHRLKNNSHATRDVLFVLYNVTREKNTRKMDLFEKKNVVG